MDLSIIICVYNEELAVKNNIFKLNYALRKFNMDFEIIVVNDGSIDATESRINEMKKNMAALKVVSYKKNRGKGYAIKKGVEKAEGTYILYTDIDLAYPVDQIPFFLKKIKESSADAVIGSRLLTGSSYIITSDAFKTVYLRHCVSRVFNFMTRMLLGLKVKDTQCGIKCFKNSILKMFTNRQRINGFCFDVELLTMAKLSNCRVVQIPVTVIHSIKSSKVRLLRDSFIMLNDILRIKKYQVLGVYNFNGEI